MNKKKKVQCSILSFFSDTEEIKRQLYNNPSNETETKNSQHDIANSLNEANESSNLDQSVISINDPADLVNPIPSHRLEKWERIQLGPYQPSDVIFPREKFGISQRQFQVNWYIQFQWLEYSKVLDAAFCFPCRCFALEVSTHRGHSDSAYTKNGFKNWNIATQKFKLHQKSSIHLGSESSLNQYLKNKPIDIHLEKQKSKLRTTMKQERLNTLMLLSIEQEFAMKVDVDEVIDNFKTKVDYKRRMTL